MTNSNERTGQQTQPQPGSQKNQQQKQGNTDQRKGGDDFEEKDEQRNSGDPDNPSETTGATESGEEDKGAK